MASPVDLAPQVELSNIKTETAMQIEYSHRCPQTLAFRTEDAEEENPEVKTTLYYPINATVAAFAPVMFCCSKCTTEFSQVSRTIVKVGK